MKADAAVIVVAAGGSARLGTPKQLLPYQGSTLLRHAAEQALAAGTGPVIVVLGAEREKSALTLAGLDVTIIENEAWQEGMAGSIRAGLQAAQKLGVDGCVIATCDQYAVGAVHLRQLVDAGARSAAGIAASSYAGTVGVPSYFSKAHFTRLQALTGDQGAKRLIQATEGVAIIRFDEAGQDVDHSGDLPQEPD